MVYLQLQKWAKSIFVRQQEWAISKKYIIVGVPINQHQVIKDENFGIYIIVLHKWVSKYYRCYCESDRR